MKFISTRKGIEATGPETVFQGLAPDGGLYVPAGPLCNSGIAELNEADSSQANSSMVNGESHNSIIPQSHNSTIPQSPLLAQAESFVLGRLFDDFPEEVRAQAVARLLSRFPAGDPIPLVDADGFKILELFHGKTGAFKDVALSMLPVFMRHAANGRRTLVLTATSGDTGSAAMQGFAGVDGTEVVVFFPDVGTSRIQRLQMTTPSDANVHAVAIRGNFDDAQAAVKRIFADASINAQAAAAGVNLSSANSINTGRLVPQIAYYLLAGARLKLCNCGIEQLCNSGIAELKESDSSQANSEMKNGCFHNSIIPQCRFDVVVPSGNFGNILAAYYAKLMGAPIGRFVVASNVNDVLARFVNTGVYDPGDRFTVTNSPSMDIRKSSNVERLLWLLSGGLDGDVERACAETARMMRDLAEKGSYELSAGAKERLFADFEGGVATPEETESEMRRMRDAAGYLLDPHTAVATFVARRLGYPKLAPCVVAATATPYKFPETCRRAFGADALDDPPPSFRDLETLPVAQTRVCDVAEIDKEVLRLL